VAYPASSPYDDEGTLLGSLGGRGVWLINVLSIKLIETVKIPAISLATLTEDYVVFLTWVNFIM
jgi:hypothetical protein